MAGKNDPRKDLHIRQIQNLSLPLIRLKGVGPKRASLLARKGLHTILDLFYFTPIRYEDRTSISSIKILQDGSPALVRGKVVYGREETFYPSRKRLFKILIRDGDSELELLWFHYRKPHLSGLAKADAELTAYGTVKTNRGLKQMLHPDITMSKDCSSGDILGFFPVYSAVEGISGNALRTLVRTSLDTYLDGIIDPVPDNIISRLGLPGLAEAIRNVHFPPNDSSFDHLKKFETMSHKRLIFDRFFYDMLTIAYRKMARLRVSKPASLIPLGLINRLKKFFGFDLTPDQLNAVEEIIRDLKSNSPMSRLLMGDVGTGKTVIAAIAAHIIVQNNQQVALMAPTQVLADQHMNYFSSLPEDMGFRAVILTGNLKKIERDRIYKMIETRQYNFIVGTHSLIQEKLKFADLGLFIIDEQQRFGVRQRALMDLKGNNPHTLVMSATPIPRTLAITIYADMDISSIREYPWGHRYVSTYLINESKKRRVFETLKQRMSEGQQAFVICPVIEESEAQDLKGVLDMGKRLSEIFSPPFRIGIIHGQLLTDKREKIMHDFHKGKIDLLVGTSVIEVGVNVSNATVMIIEHPERFGLAQLHQLRGRVGRGINSGICFLMLSKKITERALLRLKLLAESHDGFEISKKDLELRGCGEFTGIKQSGVGETDLSEMIMHEDLFTKAKQEAQDLIKSDPELSQSYHSSLMDIIESILQKPLDI